METLKLFAPYFIFGLGLSAGWFYFVAPHRERSNGSAIAPKVSNQLTDRRVESADQNNEVWLSSNCHSIIKMIVAHGIGSLGPWDRLIYCLWVADFAMRKAGDLNS